MREPAFWRERDLRARASAPLTRLLLTPIAGLYRWAGARRLAQTTPFDPNIPVICVGNLTLGGAGKTPVAAALRKRLSARDTRVATLSRGYGGRLKGPLKVDPSIHDASDVGDEPLMLAGGGESWIGAKRAEAAAAMVADGVQLIIMDDGHQNPDLKKTLSFVVVDAGDPFGNGLGFPKGPLREPIAVGTARADAIILMGEGPTPPEFVASACPILRARLAPATHAADGRYVAFAGIGRPQKFFDALTAAPNIELADAVPFPDHHAFSKSDLSYLQKLAAERDAQLITTEKDHVRLPVEARREIKTYAVECVFDDPARLDAILEPVL